jgi:hypothetical protein
VSIDRDEDDDNGAGGQRAAPPPLDACHRVAGAEASLDYRFRSGMLRISESDTPALCSDCTMAFALNSSNWLAATAEPRCALERLARAIFERHTAGVEYNPETSGAEWWAQVRRGGDKHESIEFHWDVDEHFCDLPGGGGVHVHPHLSTVTYLTPVGAPTLILDTMAPASASTGAVKAIYGPITSGAISFPCLGKTIVFDGSKLHGAVPPAKSSGAPNGARRVTFLVNVWLNHRPYAVEPLPAKLAKSMSQQWRPHAQHGAFASELKPAPKWVVEGSVLGDRGDEQQKQQQQQQHTPGLAPPLQLLQVAFGRNDKVHALRALVPNPPAEGGASDASGAAATPSSAASSATSYRLVFKGSSAQVGPNDSGLRTSGPKKRKR